MPRNIELKVACSAEHLATISDRLTERIAVPLQRQSQQDTYFRVGNGRLKLREITAADDRRAELIQYKRPDVPGARTSAYRRIPVDANDAGPLREALESAIGLLVIVRKLRSIAVVGSTRIHLDDVECLGHFVEIETILDGFRGDDEAGRNEFEAVIEWLELARLDAIPGSYSDLLVERGIPV